ncbi:MAG TPA: DoxX family protein [Acidimicrobiales bacterium]|nr:DoxX family protein [Acidimicrobiales bacterium]
MPTSPTAASLLLRLALGPTLAYHGWNKVAGPGGLKGTTGWFEALGLRPAAVHARMAAATELGAGVALTVGVASPLPEAAAIGLMAVAARTDHRGKGFFVFKGGWEYTAVVAAAATALAALGPGAASVDHLVGRDGGTVKRAVGALGLGVGSAAALLAASYRPTPSAGV